MHPIDWLIIVAYLSWVVWHGLKLTKHSTELEGYFLAKRSLPWWAVGLSVMATQLSAITMIGTTGQAYADGMRFLQFYFALPLAMVIICVTFVPFFTQARVYTAYEYLERRFDSKTRTLTSFLFLMSRGMSCGVIISAPAVVLSVLMGLNLTTTCLLIGGPTAVYTMFGGVQAVAWTDVKQMVLIIGSLLAAVTALILGLPKDVTIVEALRVAGAAGRLTVFDFRWDVTEQYTFWSGTIAALFLFMSYFGTDQSQVQRYLAAKSVDEARTSLLMSAYWKIPLQALVLLVGVFMFLFFLFTPAPMLFNPVHERAVKNSAYAPQYAELEQRFTGAVDERREAAERLARAEGAGDPAALPEARDRFRAADKRVVDLRGQARTVVRDATGDRNYNDVNYVFPTFVLKHLPVGLVGLIIAGIFAAAMSASSAELASLSTATVIDFYRRFVKTEAADGHYLRVSRVATGFWGLFACIVAIYAAEIGSLIEVVNRFGSFFYGSILGVFLLAIGWKRAGGTAAFVALIAGMGAVAWVATFTKVAFLWHNVVGAVVVFVVGMALSLMFPNRKLTGQQN